MGHSVVNILETSAADSQESIDLLLASAIKVIPVKFVHIFIIFLFLKENLQFSSCIMVKSPEEISQLMIPTPAMKRKDPLARKKVSCWSRMSFLPKYSI